MWTMVRTSLSELIALPSTMVLARLLSPSDFGIAAIATFFGRLAARLSNAGVGIALVRIKILRDEHVSSVFVISAALTAVTATALIGAGPAIARFYRTPEIADILPIVALDFVISALSIIPQALLTRSMRYRDMAALGSADTTTAAVGAVVFAWFGLHYWSIPLGVLCGSAVKWIWAIKLVGWHLRFRFVPSAARELMSFALGTYTKGMLEYFSQNADNLVIGRVLGIDALGLYDKAFSSVQRVYNKLTVGGPSVSFRALAIMQDEPERFRRAFEKIMIASTLVGYATFATLGTMGPYVIEVLFGEKWRPSIVPFQLLCAAGALKVPSAFGGAAANARGWIWSNVWRQALQVVCIVVGVYAAAPWGINGASTAVLASTAIMFALTQSMLHAATGLGWPDLLRPQVPGILLAASLTLLVWGIDVVLRSASNMPAYAILASQTAGASLFAVAFISWCPFRDVRLVVHEIVNDVSPRLANILVRDARV
jgi:PST family polysaccharide transporter